MKTKESSKRRNAFSVMAKLVVLVKPLVPIMVLAVLLGVLGYLCAILLSVFASAELCSLFLKKNGSTETFVFPFRNNVFALLVILSVLRGFLHYGEQYCNHFVAFKLLAIIRHKVFAALRRLCPAKLETRDKGNLISLITSDIELLEVFYAHTISPVMIAGIVSIVMCVFLSKISLWAGLWAAFAYLVVGVFIPILNSRLTNKTGYEFRNEFGELNTFILDSLRGLDETLQYDYGTKRKNQIEEKSLLLGKKQNQLNKKEALQRALTTFSILFFGLGMFFILQKTSTAFPFLVTGTVLMMGSFGPVVALSNLSNNLNQTIASGNRVLNLLEEEPVVKESFGNPPIDFENASAENVSFAYDKKEVLKDFTAVFQKGKMIGIHGASGSGKSTLLRLLMRFWDVDSGEIKLSGKNIKDINTESLRTMQAYITQETYIFNGTIFENITLGSDGFTKEQVIEAAKKASLHDFIMSLPKDYDTKTGELGSFLSGGEKQRIGLARAFLYDAPFMLLDEPTSNLDSLNEAVILKSLKDSAKGKTLVMVSHRKSTLSSVDEIIGV